MGFGQIRFGGLASGLDTNAIISALLSVESRGVERLETRKEAEQGKISLFGTLEGLVSKLQDKARELSSSRGILGYAVSLSDEGVATFSVTGAPTSGAHTLEVTHLASVDRYTFDGVTDPDLALSAGTLSFDYDGTSYSFNGGVSLNQLAADINTQAGEDVTATVINTGTSVSPNYKLVVAGDDTGSQFTLDNLSVGIAELSINPPDRLSTASNAQVVLDGLTIDRTTNVFDDVIPGLAFTVREVTTAPISVDVSLDAELTKTGVREFVDAYNAVIDFINGQSAFDAEEGSAGPLFGDSSLRTIRGAIHQALFYVDPVLAQSSPYSTLGLVGVDLQIDGRLKLDENEFEQKLLADPSALENLFNDPTSGLLVELDAAIENLVATSTDPLGNSIAGLFDRRRDTLNRIIGDLDDEIERLERRLESLEETLVRQFSNLEGLLANLNSQASFLAGAFAPPGTT